MENTQKYAVCVSRQIDYRMTVEANSLEDAIALSNRLTMEDLERFTVVGDGVFDVYISRVRNTAEINAISENTVTTKKPLLYRIYDRVRQTINKLKGKFFH